MSTRPTDYKPCPFCGSADIAEDIHRGAGTGLLHRGDDVWTMACYSCGAGFPGAYRREFLVEKWNRRAGDSEEEGA